MTDWAASERRRKIRPAGVVVLGFIAAILLLPTAVFAVASGLGLVRLPYQLFLVQQRLPVAFPLHMIASGLALILIPIAAFTRHRRDVHRAAGRLAAGCVVVGGLTALLVALASEASVAGRAGFFVQGVVWLALLVAAIAAIRQGRRGLHARLMIAMASVASGAIWLRLVTLVTVAFGLPYEPVYAVAAWACWLVPLGIALLVTAAADARETAPPGAAPDHQRV